MPCRLLLLLGMVVLSAPLGGAKGQSVRLAKSDGAMSVDARAVEVARAVALKLGKNLPSAPPEIRQSRRAMYTGDEIRTVIWAARGSEFSLDVDVAKGQVVGLIDYDEKMRLDKVVSPQVSRDQAVAILRSLSKTLGLSIDDWQLQSFALDSSDNINYCWKICLAPYHAGYLSLAESVQGTVSTVNGKVASWSRQTGCDHYVGGDKPAIGAERAATIARVVFGANASGTKIQKSAVIPAWMAISRHATYAKLAYPVLMDVAGAERDSRGTYQVFVDAMTGEVWDVEPVSGSGSRTARIDERFVSPRMKLVRVLLASKAISGRGAKRWRVLADAVVMGRALASDAGRRPGVSYRQANCPVGGESVVFAFERKSHCLLWQTKAGHWEGVVVAEGQVGGVKAELGIR